MGQSQLLSLIYQYNSVGPVKIILIYKITIKQQGLDANTIFLDKIKSKTRKRFPNSEPTNRKNVQFSTNSTNRKKHNKKN